MPKQNLKKLKQAGKRHVQTRCSCWKTVLEFVMEWMFWFLQWVTSSPTLVCTWFYRVIEWTGIDRTDWCRRHMGSITSQIMISSRLATSGGIFRGVRQPNTYWFSAGDGTFENLTFSEQFVAKKPINEYPFSW